MARTAWKKIIVGAFADIGCIDAYYVVDKRAGGLRRVKLMQLHGKSFWDRLWDKAGGTKAITARLTKAFTAAGFTVVSCNKQCGRRYNAFVIIVK